MNGRMSRWISAPMASSHVNVTRVPIARFMESKTPGVAASAKHGQSGKTPAMRRVFALLPAAADFRLALSNGQSEYNAAPTASADLDIKLAGAFARFDK